MLLICHSHALKRSGCVAQSRKLGRVQHRPSGIDASDIFVRTYKIIQKVQTVSSAWFPHNSSNLLTSCPTVHKGPGICINVHKGLGVRSLVHKGLCAVVHKGLGVCVLVHKCPGVRVLFHRGPGVCVVVHKVLGVRVSVHRGLVRVLVHKGLVCTSLSTEIWLGGVSGLNA